MPGGRPKGSKDRPRRALHALLQEKYPGFNAVLEMVDMYHESTDRPERERLLNSIAPYLMPKLKAVEVETVNHQPVRVEIVQYGTNTEQPGES